MVTFSTDPVYMDLSPRKHCERADWIAECPKRSKDKVSENIFYTNGTVERRRLLRETSELGIKSEHFRFVEVFVRTLNLALVCPFVRSFVTPFLKIPSFLFSETLQLVITQKRGKIFKALF